MKPTELLLATLVPFEPWYMYKVCCCLESRVKHLGVCEDVGLVGQARPPPESSYVIVTASCCNVGGAATSPERVRSHCSSRDLARLGSQLEHLRDVCSREHSPCDASTNALLATPRRKIPHVSAATRSALKPVGEDTEVQSDIEPDVNDKDDASSSAGSDGSSDLQVESMFFLLFS